MKKVTALVALIVLAASGAVAQDLYFTTTQSDQIWVAARDGSGTPTVLFDGAVGSSTGPTGMVVVLDTVQKIFYGGGNSWNIYAANVDGSGTPTLLWDDECCEHLGVTADPAAGVLYWTTENGNAIRKGNMDGSGVIEDVFTGIADAAVGITLDRAAGVLYWTSVAGDVIVAGNADGSGTPTVLFDSADGVDGPRQIVVDPAAGRLYWTQHPGGGDNQAIGQIMVGNADGSGTPIELYTTTAPLVPYGIDYDADAGDIYWVEFQPQGNLDRIMRAPVDGGDPPTVLYSGDFGSVRGLAAAANLIPVELMGLSVD